MRWWSSRASRPRRCTGAARRWRPGSVPGPAPGSPRRRASITSGLSSATAEDNVSHQLSRRCPPGGRWPRDSGAPQPVGHGGVLQVAAGHRVTHGLQHGGDGAHAGAPDAHDMHVDGSDRSPSVPVPGPAALTPHPRPAGRPGTGFDHPCPGGRGILRPRDAAARPMASRAQGSASSRSSVTRPARPRGSRRPPDHGAPARLEHPGVGGLVIARSSGERHQHRRDAGHRQLGHGHRPGPAHHHIGRRVDGVHPLLVGHPRHGQDPVRRPAPAPCAGGPAFVPLPVAAADDVVDRAVGSVPPTLGPVRSPTR
jgi:hypothetical protein